MRNKNLGWILFCYVIVGCNNNANTTIAEGKNAGEEAPNISGNNLLAATINGTKTSDKAPLIIVKKAGNNAKESISISGVFNDINSHVGLLIVKDTGSLSTGKYLLQQDGNKTNGRYETNINGGTTAIENTLYDGAGSVMITRFDTTTKKIIADINMDAVNKIHEKVHITAHVNSSYK